MSNICLGVLDGFSFLMEFLGYVLVGDCVLAILRFFYRLKEEFCGEIKCRFLGFWLGKRAKRKMMELFQVNKRK